MPAYNDTDAYPVFDGATAKRDLLRYLWAALANTPNRTDILFCINNSDLSALTDGATVYNPLNTFAA